MDRHLPGVVRKVVGKSEFPRFLLPQVFSRNLASVFALARIFFDFPKGMAILLPELSEPVPSVV